MFFAVAQLTSPPPYRAILVWEPRLLVDEAAAERALGFALVLTRAAMAYAKLVQRLIDYLESGCSKLGHRSGERYGRTDKA